MRALNLTLKLQKGLKISHGKKYPTLYDIELKEHKQIVKEKRKEQSEIFWNKQTLVENKFIEDYEQKQLIKKNEKIIQERGAVVNIALDTQLKIQQFKKKYEKKELNFKKYKLEQEVQKINRQRILQVLQEESQTWLNQENINQFDENSLMPDYVFDESDYYLNLQQEALLLSQGKFDELEELNNEEKFVVMKNKLIMPLYAQIKQIIKFMKQTPLKKLQKEFEVNKALLKQKGTNQEEFDLLQKAFVTLFNELIKQQRTKQVQNLHNEIIKLYNLIEQWSKYTEILKMSNSHIKQYIEMLESSKNPFINTEDQIQANDSSNVQQVYTDTLQQAEEINDKQDDIIDFEKQKEIDSQMKKEFLNNFKKTVDQQKKEEKNELDKMMEEIDSNKEQLEKEFQEIKEEGGSQLYLDSQDSQDIKTFLNQINLDNVLPKNLVEEALTYQPKLTFETFEDIISQEQNLNSISQDIIQNQEKKQLRTSVVCQVYKDRLKQIENQGNLSRQQKNQIKEISQLIDIISEKYIVEPRFLIQVWNSL